MAEGMFLISMGYISHVQVVPPKIFHSWGQIGVIAKMMFFALLLMNTDLEISEMFR